MDVRGFDGDKLESRLYVGNLDFRISESDVIKMFSPFGKITAEDFPWHTRGPKRREPWGYAFVQYTTKEVRGVLISHCQLQTLPELSPLPPEVSMQEAKLAKEKMNGKLVCGRPMVVHLAGDKCSLDSGNSQRAPKDKKLAGGSGGKSGQTDSNGKIAAIRNKLKSLEEPECNTTRPRLKPDELTGTREQSHKKF